jgi:hypothetical protein
MTKAHEQLERALQTLQALRNQHPSQEHRLPGLADVRVGAARIAAAKSLAKYREQRETGVELASQAEGVLIACSLGDEILG